MIFLTGLPCSGKTTIGLALVERLRASGKRALLLDGDELRQRLWPDLGYSRKDRDINVRRIGEYAESLTKNRIVPVVAVVSPFRSTRAEVRAMASTFIEVYVNAPTSICEERDVKGMYRQARRGELPGFTGVDGSYEPPLNPEVICRTDSETVAESVDKILEVYNRRKHDTAAEQMGMEKRFPGSQRSEAGDRAAGISADFDRSAVNQSADL
jgi:adenylylsulfate kinase